MKEFRFGAIAKKRLDIQFELAKELFVFGASSRWDPDATAKFARKCFEAASIFIAIADDITNDALSQCNDETE